MATVDVRVDDFEDGALPRICAASGVAADRPYGMRACYRPSWPVIFILLGPLGWLIMLVVAAGTERRVDGSLPFADTAYDRTRSARRSALIHLGEVVVLTVGFLVLFGWLGSGRSQVGALVVGLVVGGACAVRASQPPGSVAVKLSRNQRHVTLRDVAPEFAAAYADQEARRVARRLADPSDLRY